MEGRVCSQKSNQYAGALRALLFRLYQKVINEIELVGLKSFGMLERILRDLANIN